MNEWKSYIFIDFITVMRIQRKFQKLTSLHLLAQHHESKHQQGFHSFWPHYLGVFAGICK